MPTPIPATDRISRRFREATAEVHERAEHSGFMSALLGEELDPARGASAFAAMQVQYVEVYAALEAAVRAHAAHPVLAPLHDARLEREERLRRDLAALRSVTDVDAFAPTAATRAYVEELRTLETAADADRAAAALAGHHYVRYLGDLSGGQAIARIVGRAYGLAPEALSFYSFDIDKPKVYKDDYRAALDGLPLGDGLDDVAVDAACRAFDHNTALFRSLEGLVDAPRSSTAR